MTSHDHNASPLSAFGTDDGSVPLAVAAALADYASGHIDAYAVVAVLRASRVLVPLVPVLDANKVTVHAGLENDDKHLATPIVAGTDGRRGLPTFTHVAALAAWRTDARPVPTAVTDLATSALQEDVDAIIVDPFGPVTFTIGRPAIEAIAQGRDWVPAGLDPRVRAAIAEALVGVAGLQSIELGASTDDADVQVVLVLDPQAEPRATLESAAERLANSPVVQGSIERGLELGYRPAD